MEEISNVADEVHQKLTFFINTALLSAVILMTVAYSYYGVTYENGMSMDRWIQSADSKLCLGKNSGKDQVVC